MAVNYTVIFQSRQWFGDRSAQGDDHVTVWDEWATAPFVGHSKDYNFACPNVQRAEEGVLQFQAFGAETRNILQINGQDIFGGLTAAPLYDRVQVNGKGFALWSTYSLIVHKNVLNT